MKIDKECDEEGFVDSMHWIYDSENKQKYLNVYSLIELQKLIDRPVFEHDDITYNIITERGDLLVSPNHKVYVSSEGIGFISNLSGNNLIKLPSKSGGFLSNLENADINNNGLFCDILLNQITENNFSLVNNEASEKCLSLVINTRFSFLENSPSLPLTVPFGFNTTSNPCCLRYLNNSILTFSSRRNFGFLPFNTDNDIITTPHDVCSIMKSCFNMFSCQGNWICSQNFFNRSSSFKQLENLPDHNSSSFKCRCSSTNLAICNNIIINFNSHNFNNNNNLYKFFYNNLSDYKLVKISDIYSDIQKGKIKVNELIFLDENLDEIEISSITKENYSGKIYDVDVENDVILVRRDKKVCGDEELMKINENELEGILNYFNESIGIIMMSKENKNNSLVLFINNKSENKAFHDMNSSFSFEAIPKRFVVIWVSDDFIDFILKNFSQDRIFFTSFVNFPLTSFFNKSSITHSLSNISETELNLMNLPSLNLLFNSSICSGFGDNSSTGCQSIESQNSQSSSVNSFVSLYLSNISSFITLINAFPSNFDADLVLNSFGKKSSSDILNNNANNRDYISFSIDELDKIENQFYEDGKLCRTESLEVWSGNSNYDLIKEVKNE